jgi:hypothetical protein
MEKLKKYAEIIEEELSRYTSISYANARELKQHLVINAEKNEFILLETGWIRHIFHHNIVFHFQLRDNRVRLFCNNTDIEIGDRLAEKGIPKSDIVVEFVHELERGNGYAKN